MLQCSLHLFLLLMEMDSLPPALSTYALHCSETPQHGAKR